MSNKYDEMEPPIWASILVVAFITGAIFGLGLEIGVGIDEAGITNFAIKGVCKATEDLEGSIKYNCTLILFFIGLISVVSAIASVIVEMGRHQSWIVGLISYVIGWVSGLVFMLSVI